MMLFLSKQMCTQKEKQLGMVAFLYTSMWEDEAGGLSQVQGQPGVQNEFSSQNNKFMGKTLACDGRKHSTAQCIY